MVVIDFHVHIDESADASANGIPVKMGRREILSNMDEGEIDISVLLVMARKGDFEKTQEQNTWLSDICLNEARFIGFGSVHPDDGDNALKEMDRCVDDLELKGFKLHPNTQGFDCDSQGLAEVLRRVGELGVPVIIDSYSPFDDTQPSKLLNTIMSVPDAKVCLAHVGMWRYMDFGVYGFVRQRTAIEMDVYFDISASCPLFYKTPFQDQFRWITEQIGPDRLLWGSDFPLFHPRTGADFPLITPKQALEIVKDFGYSKEWIPRIIGENARSLLEI
jgi:predicted TIM-barrel fold metal-dependent hydrolase